MINTRTINKNSAIGFVTILLILIVLIQSSVYIVDQREQVLVLQFGKAIKIVNKPGIKLKVPFIQDLVFFDNRILSLDSPAKEVIALDQKRLIVDAFAKVKIIDPLKLYETVRDEEGMTSRLNSILDSSIRQVLGGIQLNNLLTSKRVEIMNNIQKLVGEQSRQFGVDVIDVRIMRADLPEGNGNAIYKRMQTAREKEAKELRATGFEEGQFISAKADRAKREIIADAKKQADVIKGEADAEASKIFASAFGRDKEFFQFYRSMHAYQNSLTKDNTKIILSPSNEFLKYMK